MAKLYKLVEQEQSIDIHDWQDICESAFSFPGPSRTIEMLTIFKKKKWNLFSGNSTLNICRALTVTTREKYQGFHRPVFCVYDVPTEWWEVDSLSLWP